MDVQITRSNDIWVYDPAVDGYTEDDILSALSGSPTISSSKLRLTSAGVISLESFRNASVEFAATIPTAPAEGEDKEWGFSNNNDKGKVVFDITDAVFSAKLFDAGGTIVSSKTINWSDDWTASEARYRITWTERSAVFSIDDTIVARIIPPFDIAPGKILNRMPLSLLFSNGDADNVDISIIQVI